MSTSLGDRLQKRRKSKNYTLEQLAEKSGVSKSYIWELENKNPPRPSADRLLALSKPLDVTLEYLMYGEEEGHSLEDSQDAKFFRDYQKMDAKKKAQLKSIMDTLWSDDD
jgi:transcriptional regulator with XRE-family HTH domain